MLRAIGRALRILIEEALEGLATRGASIAHTFGRFVYSWFRGDREISDAVALLVAGSTLMIGLLFLVLLAVSIIGVFSWLNERSTPKPSPGRSTAPEPTNRDEPPWWA